MSNDRFRELALALPEAYEQDHFGEPSFRVRKRIFAALYPSERRAVLKLSPDDQTALVELAPDIFSLGGWSHQGWTHVCLKSVRKAQIEDLIRDAWAEVAPKRAIRALEEADAGGRVG